MSTFKRCPKAVDVLAKAIIAEYGEHVMLARCEVVIDFLFAHAPLDNDGFPKSDALHLHGCRALGIARILPVKQRVCGRGDAEIALDGDWWNDASEEQRKSLLDHELHHLTVAMDKMGKPMADDFGRPKLRMRKHDFEFGWFSIIAARHGMNSIECQQAAQIRAQAGTWFFPDGVMEKLTQKAA